MSWFDRIETGRSDAPAADAAERQRLAEWETALTSGRLPSFVESRLAAAASGKAPWIATLTPAELALARGKGIRPLAMVSGTCWYHYGWSWTEGHAAGWHLALSRMRQEALVLGAHAIVDVKLRKIAIEIGDSMDFTVIGTAVRIDGLATSPEPVVATLPALEFVRLLEAGIVPVGIAIGAQYSWLTPFLGATAAGLQGSYRPFANAPLTELTRFWEGVRRCALAELARDAGRQGNGVLAHTHFGELIKIEGGNNGPPRFLGRHIVIGTVVDTEASAANREHAIRAVVDLCEQPSPLLAATAPSHSVYSVRDEEGVI